jgi:hypothetical protein
MEAEKVDFSRRVVFSKVRVYSRAYSGYNIFVASKDYFV